MTVVSPSNLGTLSKSLLLPTQINSYLNAELYLFRFTPTKMIKDKIVLRADREQAHYKLVLERFLKLLWMVENEKSRNFPFLTEKIFVKNVTRPWGEEGEEVDCFAIDLNYVFEPVAENECKIMLVEPRGVVNTGEEDSEFTSENDVWI